MPFSRFVSTAAARSYSEQRGLGRSPGAGSCFNVAPVLRFHHRVLMFMSRRHAQPIDPLKPENRSARPANFQQSTDTSEHGIKRGTWIAPEARRWTL